MVGEAMLKIIVVEKLGSGRFRALASVRVASNVTVNCPGYGETEEDACEDARQTAHRKISEQPISR